MKHLHGFWRVLRAEVLKLKRITVIPVTFLVSACMALALAGFTWIMINPGMASNLGLIGQKAVLAFGASPPGWPAFIMVLEEMAGLGGMLLASVILAWLFSVEYLQGTAKVMLVLPVGRSSYVIAKILLALVWLYGLFTWNIILAFFLAQLAGLPPPDTVMVLGIVQKVAFILLVDFAVSLPVALIALASKGIFAPLGYAIASLLLATLFGSTGWGPYVPWAIVAIISGAGSPGLATGAISWVIIAISSSLALFATLYWYETADNQQ